MRSKLMCLNSAMHYSADDILLVRKQLTKSCRVVSSGLTFSRMPPTMFKHVIGVKGLGTSQREMRCHSQVIW